MPGERLFRSCVQAMNDGVLIFDNTGAIVECNPAAEQLLAVSAPTLLGRTDEYSGWRALSDDLSEMSAEEYPGAVAQRTGEAVLGTVMAIHTPEGERRWLHIDAVPLSDDLSGEPVGAAIIFHDITAQRTLEKDLARAKGRLTQAREATAVGLWEWDMVTDALWHDEGITAIAGRPVLTIADWLSLVHPDDRARMADEVALVIAGRPSLEVHYRSVLDDGTEKFLLQRAVIVESDGDVPTRMAGTTVDSTELHRATERAEELLDRMTDAYFVVSPDWELLYVNVEAELVIGRSRHEMVGQPMSELFPDAAGTEFARQYSLAQAGQSVQFEAYYAGLDRWFEVRAHPVPDGIAIYFRDVNDRRHAADEREALLRTTELAKDELAYAASHDALTDLPNRVESIAWLESQLTGVTPTPSAALLFVDLDRFKLVNDTHGHAEGDLLLIEAARRLRRLAPASAMVARLGGDEFVIGLPEATTASASAVAKELLDAFEEPFVVGDRRLVVTASIGIAVARAGATPVTLLSDADAALYRAKDGGRNRFAVFDDDDRQRVVARLHIEADLRDALDQHQIVAHYQPIFDAASGRPVAVEALARWTHPQRGVVTPDEFIPVAEESGLILAVGEHMLDVAIGDRQELSRLLGCPTATVWVNVSARQLEGPTFAGRLVERVEAQGIGGLLGIEITERVLSDDATAARLLETIAAAGVRIAIDDFGTGYSSLSRLVGYPVDTIKIDRSFIVAMPSPSGRSLVAAIVELAHAVGAVVCAEGVEDPQQMSALRDMGVDLVSGFHLARPAPLEELRSGYRRQPWS